MSEIIFVLTATVLVFALFLLVFFIKDRSAGDNGHRSSCTHCGCQCSQEQHEHFLGHPKSIEKNGRS
jgi:hypothetical protein